MRDLAAQAEKLKRRDFSKVDSQLRSLLEKILVFNPVNRPTASELLYESNQPDNGQESIDQIYVLEHEFEAILDDLHQSLAKQPAEVVNALIIDKCIQ